MKIYKIKTDKKNPIPTISPSSTDFGTNSNGISAAELGYNSNFVKTDRISIENLLKALIKTA